MSCFKSFQSVDFKTFSSGSFCHFIGSLIRFETAVLSIFFLINIITALIGTQFHFLFIRHAAPYFADKVYECSKSVLIKI